MSDKTIDITKTGPAIWKQLREANDSNFGYQDPELDDIISEIEGKYGTTSAYNPFATMTMDVSSPLVGQSTMGGNEDYWGNSAFDSGSVNDENFSRLSDLRAEAQPWYSKLINGIAKAGVLAATTALETGGLLYGIGQGAYEAAQEDGDLGDKAGAFLHGMWYNPITRALKKVNDYAEDYMPNYYTQDEIENPFHNIFTANFLGDKIIKNLGFMVGAFYGGIPLSKAIGSIGVDAVKAARATASAERVGMAKKIQEITEEAAKTGEDVGNLLKKAHLTDAERAEKIKDGFDNIRHIAQTTRATSMALGSLGSAINEGAIEAINNSEDWFKTESAKENDRYQNEINALTETYGNSEVLDQLLLEAENKHNNMIASLEKERASMGNADLLFNLPILMASNMFQLGKLYARGFDSSRRTVGNLWNGYKLPGSVKDGTLKSTKSTSKGIVKALMNGNAEGLEEYLQRSASDAAGKAVSDSIERYVLAGEGEDSKADVDDYLVGFAKAVADNLGNPQAWEEYMIGAVSSRVGMPVFGSQTKNAYLGKNKPVGLAGGFWGDYQDYKAEKKREEKMAEYLNDRVTNPDSKFYPLYEALRKNNDLDALMRDPIALKDKAAYKELEFEKLFNDINAFASSGHLAEYREMIGYNKDYTDEELEDIIESTSKPYKAEDQKKDDEAYKKYLEELKLKLTDEEDKEDLEHVNAELKSVEKRLSESYKDTYVGPFVKNVNGKPVYMNINEEGKEEMRGILDRNREKLLKFVDDYVRVRDEIDVESDGRLEDEDINLLTQMKMKLLDYDARSAEMTVDIVNGLKNLKDVLPEFTEVEKKRVESLQKTVKDLEDSAERETDEKKKNNLKAQAKIERTKLANAETMYKRAQNFEKSLETIIGRKKASPEELAAEKRVRGHIEDDGMRDITPDELEFLLSNKNNVAVLLGLIAKSNNDAQTKERLASEVWDINDLAEQKLEYRKTIEKALGDPEYLNNAFKQPAKDKVIKKEEEVKVKDYVDTITNAKDLFDLDNIISEMGGINSELVTKALEQVKKTGSKEVNDFVNEYEKGYALFNSIRNGIGAYSEDIQGTLKNEVIDAWQLALASDKPGLESNFADGIRERAELFRKTGIPVNIKIADAFDNMLNNLNIAKSVANTNSKKATSVPEKGATSNPGKSSDPVALRSKHIQNIEKTMREKGTFHSLDELRTLKQAQYLSIMSFNENYKDHEITDADIRNIAEEIEDAQFDAVQKESSNDVNASSDVTDTAVDKQRAREMSADANSSFKGDYVTEFISFNKESNRPVTIRIPFDPLKHGNPNSDPEQLNAIRELLIGRKAYKFINNNMLGYLEEGNEMGNNTEIYFLRNQQAAYNSDSNDPNSKRKDIIFVAVKIGDKEREIFKRKVGDEYEQRLSLVTIGGDNYQIIGVASTTLNADTEVQTTFSNFVDRVVKDNPVDGETDGFILCKMEEKKDVDGKETVTRTPFKSYISRINTGRLDVKNNERDDVETDKVDLLELLENPAPNEDGSPRDVPSSEEKRHLRFAVNVNGEVIVPGLKEYEIVRPSDTYLKNEDNNGALFLYVQKPDGRYYPIRVTRKTIKEWMENGGESRIQAVMRGEDSNEYLIRIVDYLRSMVNKNNTESERIGSRTKLAALLNFVGEVKFHIEKDKLSVTYHGTRVTYDLHTNRNDMDADVMDMLNRFKSLGVQFTLPSANKEDSNIDTLDIINANVFKVGMRGFFNFNANMTIVPINGNNEMIVINAAARNDEVLGNNYRDKAIEVLIEGDSNPRSFIVSQVNNTVISEVDPKDSTKRIPLSEEEKKKINIFLKAKNDNISLLDAFIADNGISDSVVTKLKEDSKFDKFKDLKTAKDEHGVLYIVGLEKGKTVFYSQNDSRYINLSGEFANLVAAYAASAALNNTSQSSTPTAVQPTNNAVQSEEQPQPETAKPAIVEGTKSVHRFIGWNVDSTDDPDDEGTEVYKMLRNDVGGIAKKWLRALQAAEEQGRVFDHSSLVKLSELLHSYILSEGNPKERKKAKEEVEHFINGC